MTHAGPQASRRDTSSNDPLFAEDRKRLVPAWLPAIILTAAAVILARLPAGGTRNSPALVPDFNTLFLGVVSLLVSILACHGYLAGQGRPVLLLGCGTLALGIGSLTSGLLPGQKGPDDTAVVYSVAAFMASMFHLAGSALLYWRKEPAAGPGGLLLLVVSYPAAILSVVAGTAVARTNSLPPFFVDGTGAAGLFAVSAALLWSHDRRNRSAFSGWYASGLGLLAAGLFLVSPQRALGSPLNWTGRAAQYLAGVCLLVAVCSAVRREKSRTIRFETAPEIAGRERTEEALRESEKKYRELVQNANSAIVRWKSDGTITFFNEYAQSFFGYGNEEILGRDIGILVPNTDFTGADLRGLIQDIVAHPGRYTQNINENVCRDGRRVMMAWTNKPVFNEKQELVEILAVGSDITERRHAEETLRRLADELKRSNEDLEQFAYAASHDLQEPLRMIRGFLQLLKDGYDTQLDAKAKEYITLSIDGSERMSQLISDLLQYSRVERKGRTLQPTDAARALHVALANLRNVIDEARAVISSGDLPTVVGDSGQLSLLFQNLIGNAVKFRSSDRPCRIHVSARGKNDQWEFSVEDNGIGIDPEGLDRVFVIFQRLHSRSKYPGTGIGLATCKRIVERHGGRIWVESKPGEGSVFRFTLTPSEAGLAGAAPAHE